MKQGNIQKIKSMMRTEGWKIFKKVLEDKIALLDNSIFSLESSSKRMFNSTEAKILKRSVYKEISMLGDILIDEEQVNAQVEENTKKFIKDMS